MDEKRFDDLAKRVGGSRRSLLKKMVGLGGAAAVARLSVSQAEAARRGYGGPSGPPPNDDYRFCTLAGGCCIECSLVFWTSASTITRRIEKCLFEQHRGCHECAEAAVAPIEGDCWTA